MFKSIPIWEVDYYIDNISNAMLIDLRDRVSYQSYHIMGAVNWPYEDRDSWMIRLPKDKVLLFYCFRGGQSMMVCKYLEPMGYDVINIANGIVYYKGKYMVRG